MKKCLLLLFLVMLLFGIPYRADAVSKTPILLYHSIGEYKGHGSKELYVTPENFEKQMTYLRDDGYSLLTFEQWEDRLKVNKSIFITFDDGYKNNLTAYSILQKLQTTNFKPHATIFVIGDFIGRENRLSVSDIQRITKSGFISIQSHTSTHPDLTKVENLSYELKNSKEKIQQMTGKPVIALAYPYGNVNKLVVAETKKYYAFGLSTIPGSFTSTNNENELYMLPRTYIKYSTTMEEFKKIVQNQ